MHVTCAVILLLNSPELQISGNIEDNSKKIFLISHKKLCCNLSLEPSQRDSSNGRLQHMFYWRNMDNLRLIIHISHLKHNYP